MASSAGSGTRLQLGSTRSPMLGTVGDSMAHANWSFLVEKSRGHHQSETSGMKFRLGPIPMVSIRGFWSTEVTVFACAGWYPKVSSSRVSEDLLVSPGLWGGNLCYLARQKALEHFAHFGAVEKNLESSCNLLQPAADTRIAWTVRRWCPTSACSNERMISLLSGVLFAYPFLHLLWLILGQTIYLRVTIVIAMTIVGL